MNARICTQYTLYYIYISLYHIRLTVYFSKLYKDYCDFTHTHTHTHIYICIYYLVHCMQSCVYCIPTVLIYKLCKGFTRKLCSYRVYVYNIYIYIYIYIYNMCYRCPPIYIYIYIRSTRTTLHVKRLKRCSSI
jgi:hypothetical protein